MALANMASSQTTGLAQMLDAVGYNYQEDNYAEDHRRFPGRVIYGSENGRGYEQWKAVTDNPYVAGQFLWVGFDFLGEAGVWPNHGSQSGLFDTRGFKKAAAWQRQAMWAEEPMVALGVASRTTQQDVPRWRRTRFAQHWNWPTSTEPLEVTAFSNCEQVGLRLNGRAVATKPVGEAHAVSFEIAYEPGELVAVGFRHAQAVVTNRLKTAGAPVGLSLELDRSTLRADNCSVAHAIVSIVDADGNVVFTTKDALTVEMQGAGRLLGLDNGDMNDPITLSSRTKQVNGGQALVLLQASDVPGTLRLKVKARGLRPADVALSVVATGP
jgi:hypothetical protein